MLFLCFIVLKENNFYSYRFFDLFFSFRNISIFNFYFIKINRLLNIIKSQIFSRNFVFINFLCILINQLITKIKLKFFYIIIMKETNNTNIVLYNIHIHWKIKKIIIIASIKFNFFKSLQIKSLLFNYILEFLNSLYKYKINI